MSRREIIRTVGGVVIIGLVVAATFMYGNKQRQDQVQHDQQLRQQQQQANLQNSINTKSTTATTSTNDPMSKDGAAVGKGGAGLTANPPSTSPTNTPQTGGELLYLIPATTLVLLLHRRYTDRQALRAAWLTRV